MSVNVFFSGTTFPIPTRGDVDWEANLRTYLTSLGKALSVLHLDLGQVGNVGAGEDVLATYTLAANSLVRASRGLGIKCWGTTANNGTAKTLKLYFGAVMLTTSLTVSVAGSWVAEAEVWRNGTNAQKYISELRETGTGNSDVEVGSLTQTETASIVIKATGEAGANNDIVKEGFRIWYL